MANRKVDKARLADIIIFAAIFGDERALERYEISIRTLRRYRTRLKDDAALNDLVAEGVAAINAHRSQEAEETTPELLAKAIDTYLEFVTQAASGEVTTAMLSVLNESFTALSEYDLALKLLNARVAQENTGEGEGLRPTAAATGPGRIVAQA